MRVLPFQPKIITLLGDFILLISIVPLYFREGMQTLFDLIEEIGNGLLEPLSYFYNREKRVNFVYLASSMLLAYYVYKTGKTTIPFYKYLFNRRVWLSKSAFVDYKYFFFNGVIKLVCIAPIVESWRYLGVETTFWMEESFGLPTVSLTENQTVILYALSVIIAYDFVFYLIHAAMHKIPFLWAFHKIHHSATTLNPITQYRLHPVELIINNLAFVFVSASLMGVFDYFYNGSIKLVVYAEANIFSMLFLFWGSNLRHSHVKLKYFSFLEKIFISPYQHQIHHSTNPRHYNKNMGAKLALWDWLFGTLIRSKENTKLKFGLSKAERLSYSSFIKSLYLPFKQLGSWLIPKKN